MKCNGILLCTVIRCSSPLFIKVTTATTSEFSMTSPERELNSIKLFSIKITAGSQRVVAMVTVENNDEQ